MLNPRFQKCYDGFATATALYYQLPEGKMDAVRSIKIELANGAKQRFPSARVLARRGYRVRGRDKNGFAER